MPRLFDVHEAAKFVGVSSHVIRNMCEAGKIKAEKRGRYGYYIEEEEVRRVRHETPPTIYAHSPRRHGRVNNKTGQVTD